MCLLITLGGKQMCACENTLEILPVKKYRSLAPRRYVECNIGGT